MFSKIALILSLLPKVIAVVKLVDEILDPATPSPEKKQHALDILRKIGLPENVIPLAGEVLDVVVAVMHFFGLLSRHKKPDEAPSVEATALAPAARKVREDVEREVAVTDEVFNEFLRATE